MLSVASLWEIQIKLQIKRLTLNVSLADMVACQRDVNNLQLLPIQEQHIYALGDLPPHHGDPFDRLLIGQANIEEALLVSADKKFSDYPVRVLW